MVYLLPGQGGSIGEGLGRAISERGFRVAGRESRGTFRALDFDQKITTIADDLRAHFWRSDGLVIANSFGAYLLLHALVDLPPFPGRALLLSPILGGSTDPDSGFLYSPPRSEKLMRVAEQGAFPSAQRVEIHVGACDWQSDPKRVERFGELIGAQVCVVAEGGHVLGEAYVSPILDRFLDQ